MKIITVLGARPQFIKASVVSKVLQSEIDIEEVIIHTGQHFDKNMSGIFFNELKIKKPNYNLGVSSLSHGAMTGRQLEKIEKILINESPDLLLVYGDTNSTLSGALAASKLHIPIAHIESGLRSFNKKMPEEINRILVDHVSEVLFVPSKKSSVNLQNEGIDSKKIKIVGDVMYDASLHFGEIAEKESTILKKLNLVKGQYILATLHRQENTDDEKKLKNVFTALSSLSFPVVMPLHPRTKKKIISSQIQVNKNIRFTEPLGYLDMLFLEKNAYKIATDSGGVQKEAYFYGVPCITLREETEWIELVEEGYNNIVGTDIGKIIEAINQQVKEIKYRNLYGDGNASEKIVKFIREL